jgi:hypothetical protein
MIVQNHMIVRIFIICMLSGLFGCTKKAEEDPALSLRSRKARLTGEWQLRDGRVLVTSLDHVKNQTLVSSFILLGSGYELSESGSGQGGKTQGLYSLSLKIKSSGLFEMTENFDNRSFSASGIWDFALASADLKKKESVNFMIDDAIGGGTNDYHLFNWGSTTMQYRIKELRHKKLVLMADVKVYLNASEQDIAYSGEFVFEQ